MKQTKSSNVPSEKSLEEGNTEPPPAQNNTKTQSYNWCFTLNNYTNDHYENIVPMCQLHSDKWIIGKEIGENGTPHLQGYMHLKKKQRLTEMKTKFGKEIHFEIAKGDNQQNWIYCSKENNYTYGGNWKLGEMEIDEESDIEDTIIKILKPWQTECKKLLEIDCDRKIIWIYEKEGNVGKSAFCKYMMYHYDANIITKGNYSDIMNRIYNLKKYEMVLFDLCRANGNKVSYNAIEDIKNGMIFNSKYKTGIKIIASPSIMIFSNEKPELDKLSKDRWEIYNIVNNVLIKVNIEDIGNYV